MTKKTKEELLRISAETRAALDKIETAEIDERNAALVGKCLRYRNSYGSSGAWWIYCKVLRVEDGDLIVHEFETTSLDEIKIHPISRHWHTLNEGWRSVSQEVFANAWAEVQRRIAELQP